MRRIRSRSSSSAHGMQPCLCYDREDSRPSIMRSIAVDIKQSQECSICCDGGAHLSIGEFVQASKGDR